MTSINIIQTVGIKESMNILEEKIQHIYNQAEQACQQLNHLSGMESVRRKIDLTLEDLQEEKMILKQVAQCLEQVCQIYVKSEEIIIDYAGEYRAYSNGESELAIVEVPEWIFQMLK